MDRVRRRPSRSTSGKARRASIRSSARSRSRPPAIRPARPQELAALPLGRRDARLLRLHAELAGERLEATAACPACGEPVEFAAEVASLLDRDREAASVAPLETEGFVVRWRPPDSDDVAAAAAAGEAAAAERVLLARCVLTATGPAGALEGPALPAAVRAAVAEAMAAADPLAEVLVDLSCPACGAAFVADLDLSGFVWAELRAHAQRLLRADRLARAGLRLERGRGARPRRATASRLPEPRRGGCAMSDFLSRVAARAVGRAPAARPRLPALFDPSPGAGAELELAGEADSGAAPRCRRRHPTHDAGRASPRRGPSRPIPDPRSSGAQRPRRPRQQPRRTPTCPTRPRNDRRAPPSCEPPATPRSTTGRSARRPSGSR